MSKIDLYNGDCLEVMDKLIEKGIKVDAIITDPPFGITACKWDSVIPFDKMWVRLNKLIKPNGAIVLFGCEPFSSNLRMSNAKNYKYDWVWEKPSGTGFLNAKRQPLRCHELISVFYKKQCLYNPQKTKGHKVSNRNSIKCQNANDIYGEYKRVQTGGSTERYPKSIIKFNRPGQVASNALRAKHSFHPTQKPVALMEYLIKTYTNENELVLDFTMGSGTTGVACVNTNRNFIGIELDEKYFEIAEERINNAKYKDNE